MDKQLIKGNVPGLILAVLEGGALHGYAIAREIERQSGAELSFKEGTLYPALHALESQRLVEAQWEIVERGPSRKIYRLTRAGRDDLERRRALWTRFSAAISQIMAPKTEEAHGN